MGSTPSAAHRPIASPSAVVVPRTVARARRRVDPDSRPENAEQDQRRGVEDGTPSRHHDSSSSVHCARSTSPSRSTSIVNSSGPACAGGPPPASGRRGARPRHHVHAVAMVRHRRVDHHRDVSAGRPAASRTMTSTRTLDAGDLGRNRPPAFHVSSAVASGIQSAVPPISPSSPPTSPWPSQPATTTIPDPAASTTEIAAACRLGEDLPSMVTHGVSSTSSPARPAWVRNPRDWCEGCRA